MEMRGITLKYTVRINDHAFVFDHAVDALEFARSAAIIHASAFADPNAWPYECEDYEPEICIRVIY